MQYVSRPHDKFFRNRFSRPQTAKAFCRHYLPPGFAAEMDIDRLEVVKDSFTDQRLQEHLADMLYRIPLLDGRLLFIYILLEHKSYLDEWALLQIMRYLLPTWVQAHAAGCSKLPTAIPLLLFHGTEEWNLPRNFHALFDLSGSMAQMRPFVPEFSYHLCDLSRYNDAEIVGGPELETTLGVMKYIFHKDLQARLHGLFRRAGELQPMTAASDLVESLARYVVASKKLEEKVVATEMERALVMDKEWGVWIPIIDDWKLQGFLEGREEGREQGREEGRQEGQLKGRLEGRLEGQQTLVLSLLRHRFQALNESLEARVRALTEEQLTALNMAAFDFEKPGDLTGWLRKYAPVKRRRKG